MLITWEHLSLKRASQTVQFHAIASLLISFIMTLKFLNIFSSPNCESYIITRYHFILFYTIVLLARCHSGFGPPRGFGPPGPDPLADLDPPVQIR